MSILFDPGRTYPWECENPDDEIYATHGGYDWYLDKVTTHVIREQQSDANYFCWFIKDELDISIVAVHSITKRLIFEDVNVEEDLGIYLDFTRAALDMMN